VQGLADHLLAKVVLPGVEPLLLLVELFKHPR
jgi:hypothetical protein